MTTWCHLQYTLFRQKVTSCCWYPLELAFLHWDFLFLLVQVFVNAVQKWHFPKCPIFRWAMKSHPLRALIIHQRTDAEKYNCKLDFLSLYICKYILWYSCPIVSEYTCLRSTQNSTWLLKLDVSRKAKRHVPFKKIQLSYVSGIVLSNFNGEKNCPPFSLLASLGSWSNRIRWCRRIVRQHPWTDFYLGSRYTNLPWPWIQW